MSELTNPIAATARAFLIAVLVTLILAVAIASAWSQAAPPAQKSIIIQVAPAAETPAPAPAPVVPPAPPAAPPAENPGLINEIGKLFQDSPLKLPALPSFKSFGESTDGLTRLNTIVKGRVACPRAANGAPDCKTASDRLCQSKGFKEGKSLDTDAAQSCSAKAMIPGRKLEEGDCKTENYVTQALCQ
ncbi:MAG: hypothetical protein JWR89_4878 [Tardiphaga sp.]|uniref:hypothetical protein n=1 Tax=Tardiphaga sp. TaxID=1926292 RepID=UPI002607F33B|nr:hypothetical protein [Tardiphaga sp.]MDB5504976.1 hypothetical protein [Tardiphaga sp.]